VKEAGGKRKAIRRRVGEVKVVKRSGGKSFAEAIRQSTSLPIASRFLGHAFGLRSLAL
jgi:hypothetical protein